MELEARHLRYFIAVAEEGTFTRAAARLGLSQPALSAVIGRLERAHGAQLFVRSSRGVRLTPGGRELLAHARAVVDAVRVAEEVLTRDGWRHTLRVAAQSATLVRALLREPRAHPEWQVELTLVDCDESIEALHRGDLDVVHGYDTVLAPLRIPSGLRQLTLLYEPVAVTMPHEHPLAGREQVGLAELADSVWVSTPVGTRKHDFLLAACRQAGFTPDVRFTATDSFCITEAIVGGGAVSLSCPINVSDPSYCSALLTDRLARRMFLAHRPGSVSAAQLDWLASLTRTWYTDAAIERNPLYARQLIAAPPCAETLTG